MRTRVAATLVVGALAIMAAGAIALGDKEPSVSRADFDRAAQAAVAATGGGQATSVDRDSENGATWEVEVTKADGTQVDVLLDAQFRVLHVGSEQDSGEPADDSDGDHDSD